MKQACEDVARAHHASLIGKEYSVLINEQGTTPGTIKARNDSYVQVILPATTGSKGDRVAVIIEQAGVFDVRARPL